jgi:hypothetical protein
MPVHSATLQLAQPLFLLLQLVLQLGQRAVLQLRRPGVILRPLRLLDAVVHLLRLFLRIADGLDGRLLLLPTGAQRTAAFLKIGQLLL